jgi:hypothetical protein
MKRVNTCSNTKNSKSIRDKKNCDTLWNTSQVKIFNMNNVWKETMFKMSM